jgi:hypothetical protein
MLVIGVVSMFAVVTTAWATKHKKPARHTAPPITVSNRLLSGSFFCHTPPVVNPVAEPVLMATGTGVSGELTYGIEQPAFNALGLQVCDVNFPHWETADLQTSVQYLVYAIRRDFKQSHRPIAVFGIGQGGLLARMALAYWPSLRKEVGDVVAVAAPEHGSTVPPHTGGSRCSKTHPCVPAIWQQVRKAHLITWIGKHHAQAPGPTSWTTVRSATDEVVRPTGGPRPTSELTGASNILIQDVCPGRTTNHAATAFDSVTFAALFDAITQPGPAEVARFPKTVCSTLYARGFRQFRMRAVLKLAAAAATEHIIDQPLVRAEPKVRKHFRR